MAIDASIYGQIQQPQIESPLNALAKVSQVSALQSQNKLYGMKLADAEQAAASKNALNAAYQSSFDPTTGSIDRNKLYTSLAQGGQGSSLPSIQKSFIDMDKSSIEAEKQKIAAAKSQIDIIGQVAGAAVDPQSYAAGRAILRKAGIDISGIPEQYDPAYVAQARNQALDAAKQLDQHWKALDFNYKQQNDAANRSVTMRGQNMTDARGRDLAEATRSAGGKPPAGYRWKSDGSGTLEVIPGGPAENGKAPTEFQGKSATFGARAEEADKIISGLEGKYSPAAINTKQALGNTWAIGGALEAAGNLALSPAGQKAEQAQRDFVNAVLRQESGAAIADSEFNNAKKQYFAQPGDSKAVIAQKAQNRKTAIEGFKRNAGRAAYSADTSPAKPSLDDIFGK